MSPLGYVGDTTKANTDTIASANTAQLLAKGAETATFDAVAKYLYVTHASHACYIARTAAKIAATEGGADGDRIYVPASASGLLIPWNSADVYFVNYTAGETPLLCVAGIV